MPSPMIYQDLTTAALLGHAAQYHSETEIVSVSTGVAGAAARRPLRYPGMEQSPPPGDLFCRRLRRLGDTHCQPAAVG